MEIVELKKDEASLCKELRLRALKDAPSAFAETYEQAIELDNSYWESIANSMVEPNTQRMFIAKDSDKYIGSVYALTDQTNATIGRLGGMWVDSLYRNKGIGKILFNSHRDWAKRLNIKFIKLWVENSESGACLLYTSPSPRDS